jgi:hypothetical protein
MFCCFALASCAKSIQQSAKIPDKFVLFFLAEFSFTKSQILFGSKSGLANIFAIPSLIFNHLSVSGIVFFLSTQSDVKLITIASSTIDTVLTTSALLFSTALSNAFVLVILE